MFLPCTFYTCSGVVWTLPCAYYTLDILSDINLLVRMKRYEKLSVQQVLHRMKSSHCTWLEVCCSGSRKHTPLAVSQRRQEIFSNWMCWLMNDFVMPLLKGYFYITESSGHRNHIFYFRKQLWKHVSQLAMKGSLGNKFEELPFVSYCCFNWISYT
jgi:telomerase reverse transcriptase